MFKKFLLLLPLLILMAGCSAQPKPEGVSTEQNPSVSSTKASGISRGDDMVKQLRAAGATVESSDPVQQPFFSVVGQTVKVSGQDVQIFEYASENARMAESGKISKDGSTIGTSKVDWVEPPHFWATGKILVLYVGKNQEVVDLLSKVLGPTITYP